MKWSLTFSCLALLFIENGLSRLTRPILGVLAGTLISVNSDAELANIADFIHPCPLDDRACLIQSTMDAIPHFSKGLPELGVPSLDPFYIEKLSLPLPGLKTSLYKGKVTGFRKAIVDNIESNSPKHKFVMEFHSNVTLTGAYEAKGRILTFPIDGEGDAKIKIRNLKMKVTMFFHVVPDENGVQHLGVKDYKYTFDYGERVTYNLTNLFKGSPELSNTVLEFINQNWRLVAEEFGKPIVEYATEMAVRSIEKFFLAVPIDELFVGPTLALY